MSKEAFHKLLLLELQDIYSFEKQIIAALPKVIEHATDPELKEALQNHLMETQHQLERIDEIYRKMGEKPNEKECKGMKGILAEGDEILKMRLPEMIKDAAIIGACQRVEHYEMASYGTARTFAEQLGMDEIAHLLQKSLTEEGNANKKLTSVAEGGFFTAGVNQKAER